MGWKFLEGIGEKVAEAAKESNEDMAKALFDKVDETSLDIDDLEIEFSEGVATISGVAADDATVEKAVLIIGNTEGVSEVEADGFIAGVTEAEKAEYAKAPDRGHRAGPQRSPPSAPTTAEATEEAEKAARKELRQRRRKAQEAAATAMSKFYTVETRGHAVEDRPGVLRRRVQVPGNLRGQQADAEERRSHLPGPGAADSSAGRLSPRTDRAEGPRSGGGLRSLRPVTERPDWVEPLSCPG